MSTQDNQHQPEERMEVQMHYLYPSTIDSGDKRETIQLACNVKRTPVQLRAKIQDPLVFREALSALYEVVSSDFRYVPKDRSAYLAYQRMRKQSSATTLWQAQQEYFHWLLRNDPLAFIILDPIISVHPDGVCLEVFSKDEGSYASLHLSYDLLHSEGKVEYGTTNIDFSKEFYQAIQKMRSYRESWLEISSEQVGVAVAKEKPAIEKKIQVPLSWIRGFLQVQSAATLVRDKVLLRPVDLYNVLRQLRLNKDQKKGGRAIRLELIPGEYPRLVLEPWEKVFTIESTPFQGEEARVVRIWGRRRLSTLQRILPLLESVEVRLLGSGLPTFFLLKNRYFTFTLGLSGFTAKDWAQATSLDLLLPRHQSSPKHLDKVLEYLSNNYRASHNQIQKQTKIPVKEVLQTLQVACQQGKLMYDLNDYRWRPLTDEPLSYDRLAFRNQQEKMAHDHLQNNAISLEKENRILGVGLELTGIVKLKEQKKEYRPLVMLDDDARVRKAECTCPFFRRNGLRQGPCSHLVALNIYHHRIEQQRRQDHEKITVETRTFARREIDHEKVYQLTLDHTRLRKRWGKRGEKLRLQNLFFDSTAQAREAYWQQIADLEQKRFLDITR